MVTANLRYETIEKRAFWAQPPDPWAEGTGNIRDGLIPP